MIHQTWAYRVDQRLVDERFRQSVMHRKAREAYRTMAAELGLRLVPTGEAIAAARNHPEWNFTTTRTTQMPGDPLLEENGQTNLPNDRQTLAQGWKVWEDDEGNKTIHLDVGHLNAHGRYLASAVFFETLFGKSVLDNPYAPPGLKPDSIALFKRIAHRIASDPANVDCRRARVPSRNRPGPDDG
jgi:hypothetical protein